ncbi:hypothetical protein MTR_8g047240 [Medicago truncatula]|uniref:Uncharacterized protein n=1 Tax=Medicago truncatula TaxID=3880 RepID=A0A072TPG9_MEDTR|nr:hypothetical protein MTR_8g047240 [Medicago truncatula]
MSKPSKLFSTNFSTIGATPTLSNGVIPNPIMSSLNTHSAQHSHLRYTYFTLVLALNRPALRTIQHCRSDCCPIELSFELKWRSPSSTDKYRNCKVGRRDRGSNPEPYSCVWV